jgi:hypothetical protein
VAGKAVSVEKPTTKTVKVNGAKNGGERVVPISHAVRINETHRMGTG